MHHIHGGKAVTLRDLEVRLVVRGRDLQHAGAELQIDMLVAHDGQRGLVLHRQRTTHVLADEMSVARVLRIDRDGLVARDHFGACGADGQPGVGFLDDLHFEIIHGRVLRLRDDFFIADRAERHGAPVHHALAAIDEALFVEVHEHALHATRVVGVHGEARAAPVAARAELLQLLQDDAAVFVLPLPDLLHEFLAAEVVAMLDRAFLAQRFLHRVLRGNARVVGAGEPEHFLAQHARAAGEDVLDGVVQHMAEREDARDVRRRDDDGIRRALLADARGVGFKAFVVEPLLIPAGFDFRRRVGLVEFGHGRAGNMHAPALPANLQRGGLTQRRVSPPCRRPAPRSRPGRTQWHRSACR